MSDSAIDAAWSAGRAAWPDIVHSREAFAMHLERLDPAAPRRFPADLYLASACLAGDSSALAAFDRDLLEQTRGAIAAIDSNRAFVDEVLQRLRVNLLVGESGHARLNDYAARGPLRAWVGIAAVRTALMLRRSQKRSREVSPPDDDWMEAVARITTSNPELDLLKRQYADAFERALRDAFMELETRARAVLKLSFVDGLSIDEIGTVYAVHRATAARWIVRACEHVSARTRALLAERLQLSSTELERMTSLVRSQLDVTLAQLLPEVIPTLDD